MLRVLCTVFMVGAVLASLTCGGDEDRLLRLPGGDITESELRQLWRDQIEQAPAAGAVICSSVAGASPGDVMDFFELPTPAPGELDPDTNDVQRAAEIIAEECASRFGTARASL